MDEGKFDIMIGKDAVNNRILLEYIAFKTFIIYKVVHVGM
jgi:hypothetical protein